MTRYILPAEFFGSAQTENGVLDIGGVKVPAPWWCDGRIAVYVRRDSADLSVMEIHMTKHDGLASEELDHQNEMADVFPLGPKEYWRGEMVGKGTYGEDRHLMTNEEFEADWAEGDCCACEGEDR